MTIKDYTRGFGPRGSCTVIIILILFFLAIPASGDDNSILVNGSNGPPPVDTNIPQVNGQDNQVIPRSYDIRAPGNSATSHCRYGVATRRRS